MSEHIYHLALESDWRADPSEPYTMSTIGMTLAEVGFIHCSFADQVDRTVARFYRDRDDVLLLEIDAARVTAPIKVERADEGGEFPHVYGPLNRDAVVRESRITCRG